MVRVRAIGTDIMTQEYIRVNDSLLLYINGRSNGRAFEWEQRARRAGPYLSRAPVFLRGLQVQPAPGRAHIRMERPYHGRRSVWQPIMMA